MAINLDITEYAKAFQKAFLKGFVEEWTSPNFPCTFEGTQHETPRDDDIKAKYEIMEEEE